METDYPLRIPGALDRYMGLEITDLKPLNPNETEFNLQLEYSIKQWETEGVRSVQIKFLPGYFQLMNIAFKHGFYLHHANRSQDYILMCKWMDTTTKDKIPAYADHYVGVGGVAINSKGEILLIQERRQPEPRTWKFPGGFMDPGETVKQAVEREVLEETGVRTNFEGILGFREILDARHSATDFYIVCVVSSLSDEIDIIDKREVFQAKWVPLSELSSNTEGEAKYKMFPNAYRFISLLHHRYMKQQERMKIEEGLTAT
jgi:ADP-ribose pyrophosphatase YjhB (NUDIX family)